MTIRFMVSLFYLRENTLFHPQITGKKRGKKSKNSANIKRIVVVNYLSKYHQPLRCHKLHEGEIQNSCTSDERLQFLLTSVLIQLVSRPSFSSISGVTVYILISGQIGPNRNCTAP